MANRRIAYAYRGIRATLVATDKSIMIQNLRNEHLIYYIFSKEHINFLMTYSFDFQIDEMLSFYISFLRAISGKLNKNTISLLVKTNHEPLSDYFSDMVKHFQKQCIDLDKLVVHSAQNAGSSVPMASIEDAIVQIEDTLYYFSDVMSSGIPDLGRFITENILQLSVFRFLLPSLQRQRIDLGIRVTTSMYLLCCILHIFKNKDMTSTVAAALFRQPDCPDRKQGTPNGCTSEHNGISENQGSSTSAVEQSNEDKLISLSSAFAILARQFINK